MDVTYIINISSALAYLIITVFLLIGTVASSDLKLPVNRWFFLTVLLSVLLVISDFTVVFCEGHTGPFFSMLARVADCFSFSFQGLSIFTFGMYYYDLLNTKIKINSDIRFLFGALSAVCVFLAIFAAFFGLYARFDEYNHYYQQNTYWIGSICPMITTAILIFLAVRSRKVLPTGEFLSLVAYPLILIVAYTIEVLFPGIWVSNFGAALAYLLLYTNIQVEARHQSVMRENQLAEARIAVMLSQIQPHFLYNSLASIEYLCDIEGAKKAVSAVQDFSEYLRGNMDSLTYKNPIPFKRELQHTNLYLSLEKRRFVDRIQTEYDIAVTDFFLPALTLQPIIENAVRHGITKRDEGGIITVRSFEDEAFWHITVTDDGVGFVMDEKRKNDHSHVGIENVRSRLKSMCGGTLEITSTLGIGTTATISIPKTGGGDL